MSVPEPSDFAAQLRAMADTITGGWAPGSLPPAVLTASSVKKVIDDVHERRAQLQALQTALGAFDEQLAALELVLAPLHEWAETWSGVEQAASRFWKGPDA